MKNIRNLVFRGVLGKLTAILLAFFIILTPVAPVFAQEVGQPQESLPVSDTPQQVDSPDQSLTEPESDVNSDESLNEDPAEENPTEEPTDDEKGEEEPQPDSLLTEDYEQVPFSPVTENKVQVKESSGSLYYEYPIVIPPGRNGLNPDLKLTYNSQETKEGSIFGYGWSDNIPYIERINKTGTENLYSSSDYNSSLTGELVDLGSGSFGSKVDNGDFLTYTLSSSVWTVKDKKGTVYKFGTNAAERQNDPNDSSHIFKWMLQEVRDANDNYIEYEYTKNGGEIYPYKITYTGNGSTDGIFEVEFLKESRSDVIKSYKTAFLVTTSYRIYEIQAKISGTWIRKYALAYSAGDNGSRALLNTITETGKDESAATVTLPAIDFDYTTSTPGWDVDTSTYTVPYNMGEKTSLLDINGDSYVDIFRSYRIGVTTTKDVYTNDGDGTWSLDSGLEPPIIFREEAVRGGSWGSVWDNGVRLADVNGDLLPDIIQGYEGPDTYDAYLNDGGTGWTHDTDWAPEIPFNYDNYIYGDYGAHPVDLNGDGLTDILQDYDSSHEHEQINTGTDFATSNDDWLPPSDSTTTPIVQIVDVNNDGLPDILHSWEDYLGVYEDTYLNKGTGAWTSNESSLETPIQFINANNFDDYGVRFLDVNGDGLMDVVIDPVNTNGSGNNTYLGTGSGWTAATSWNLPSGISGELLNGSTTPVDLNQDGMVDFLYGATSEEAYINKTTTPTDLLKKITYPAGGNTEVTYQKSAKYKDGATILNPDLPINLTTVKTITHDDGLGGTDQVFTYSYEGGLYYYNDAHDRKFAGFQIVTRTDSASNVIKTYYHQGNGSDSSNGEYSDHVSKIGKPYRIEVKNGSNMYLKTINKWDKYDLSNGRNFVKLVQTIEMTYDGDSDHIDKATTYSYSDSTGNLTGQVDYGVGTGADAGTFSDSGTDDFTTANSYVSTTSPRLVGLMSQSTVTDHSSAKVRESKYYYDAQSAGAATKGNLTKQEDWKVSSTYVNIQKTYDSTYGTLASDIDQRGKTTTYTNDSYNLYPETVTNELDQETDYEYDYSLGKPKQITDINDRVFQIIYDGLDRVKEIKQPDLTTPASLVTKTAFAYTDTSGSVKVQQTDYLDGSTSVDTYTYYDGLSRPIQVRKEMETSNTYAVTDTIYNNIGKTYRESLPYTSTGTSKTSATGTTALLITYSYDPMYRISSVVNAAGTTSNAYDDWKMTITDPRTKVKDLYKDAFGTLVRVDEHKSGSTYSTYYEYNGNKKLTKITDALGNIRNFTYDGLGRRLTSQDLHASADTYYGSWTYTYDDFGNLTSIVDPKSQTINYTYDDLNRIETENYTGTGGTEVTYTYDSGTDGVGRLTSVNAVDADTTYVYNPHGLIKQEVKNINSTDYQTDYTRDRQGNILTITNDDSSIVKYTYNTAGQLETIQRKESTDGGYIDLVTDFDYGPHGKVILQQNSNNTTTEKFYDAAELYRLSRIWTYAQHNEESLMGGGGESEMSSMQAFSTLDQDDVVPLESEESEKKATSCPSNIRSELSQDKNANEFALIKANSVARCSVEGTYNAPEFDLTIELKELTKVDDQSAIQVFARAWKGNNQLGFGSDGSVEWERFVINNPPILVPDEKGDIVDEFTDYRGNHYRRVFREDPKAALQQVIAHNISLVGKEDTKITEGKRGNTTYTFYPNANTESTSVDGDVTTTTGSWSSIHNASVGHNSDDSGQTLNPGAYHCCSNDGIQRTFTLFDTSSLSGSSEIVSGAVLSLYVNSKLNGDNDGDDYLNVVQTSPASNTALTTDDYDQVGSTEGATAIDLGSITTSAYNDWTLNSTGRGWVTKSGVTKLGFREGHDIKNTGPISGNVNNEITAYAADRTGTTQDPKLVLTLTPPPNDPPTAPTSLQAETQTNPVNVMDTTPEFSAIYNDPDTGDTATHYRIQVSTVSNFASTVWDSSQTSLSPNITEGNRNTVIAYGGTALDLDGALYYWRMKFWDDSSAEGSWSSAATFTMYDQPELVLQDLNFDYDANGNIIELIDASDLDSSKEVDYVYDDLNRLSSATATNVAGGQSTYTKTYTYNAIGNITAGDAGNYAYDGDQSTSKANPHAVTSTSVGSIDYTYDNNGNLTNDEVWTHTWDYNNRLIESDDGVTDVTYAYDHSVQRVEMDDGTTTMVYPTKYYETDGTDPVKHIYDANGLLIATVNDTGVSATVYHVHSDQLTGSSVLSDSDGYDAQLLDYMPFGGIRINSGSYNESQQFAGSKFDTGTELNYLGARYYNSAIGRFISQDSAFRAVGDDNQIKQLTRLESEQYLSDPQGMNSFTYARNNPLTLYDPTGNYWLFAGTRASRDITKNAANITFAASKYKDVSPSMVAGVIYQERFSNVDPVDYADQLGGLLGINTSVGLGQVRVNTLKLLMNEGYVAGLDTHTFKKFGIDVTNKISDQTKYVSLLSDPAYNTLFVAAYLQYIIDTWKDVYPNIANDPAILGTLYNLGTEQTSPNSNPKPNEFGKGVSDNQKLMTDLLNKKK